jgi:Diacylglycerol kinase catalytic domain
VDIAVVVNPKARRGGAHVARACRERLPGARVFVSRSLDETVDFARELRERPPRLVLSAGGDGTAVHLLNALLFDDGPASGPKARALPGADIGKLGPALGILPLGTGNGWARASGAPAWRAAVNRLEKLEHRQGPLPVLRFDLVEAFGTVAHFAGTGWDAELISDFHHQKQGFGVMPLKMRQGLAGYLNGLFTRTVPRHVVLQPAEVELVNTGDDALTVDDQGRVVPLAGGEHGKVLYRGPTTVCAAGTTPEWGFGFRAFPFAGVVPRRFCMRLYAGHVIEAVSRMKRLWRGEHPLQNMHTWLLTRCVAKFSRPVPFQIGGDTGGEKTEIEYALAHQQVDILDWGRLAS